MILQALCDAYDILANDDRETTPVYGFCQTGVTFALIISETGKLTNIIDLRAGEKLRPQEQEVPFQKTRSGTIPPPYFLCDKAEYVLGLEHIKVKDVRARPARKTESDTVLVDDEQGRTVVSRRSQDYFTAFRALHHELLSHSSEPAARAFLAFLDAWDPASAFDNQKIREYREDLLSGGRIVIRVGDVYLHQIPAIRDVWAASSSRGESGTRIAQCLVSGSVGPIARTHQAIKGVSGAQPSGASLVSFNEDAFCSYDKEQSYNAPVSEISEFKYTTALNRLIASPDHRLRIGDTTTVFWAQTEDRDTEAIIRNLLDPPDTTAEEPAAGEARGAEASARQVIDDREQELIRDVLRRVRSGTGLRPGDLGRIKLETPCFILGLAPNAGRLSVRFWHRDSFGNLAANLAQHHLDLEIDRRSFEPAIFPVYRVLFETVPRKAERKDPPPALAGQLMRSVLLNVPYPFQLYSAILNRVRTDHDLNHVRAGVIKAYLLRLARAGSGVSGIREEMITVSLDETNPNVPYRLGRLFAVLEKAQADANRDREVGSTIKNRYFGSASSTPAVVFPPLIKLAQHHIAKSEWGWKTTQRMEEIMSGIDAFPTWLGLEEQGMFMLGYYHQRRALFTKKNGKTEEVTAHE
ncbi:MAG TPA: type I-C CRISPR-associated protein Cas8c/Csd1 [Methanoregulaceae archaeon]|nr:type I-C CRISPR-associated protein Cas8c/Csd1 [Methanoregulaceae archaeon]